MAIERVCVLGGGGFIGRRIVTMLAERGVEVRVLTRDRERVKRLIVLPAVEVTQCDIHQPASLAAQFQGMDAVINLVGILHEKQRARRDDPSRRGDFHHVHVELPRKVINACREAGVGRYLHMSALGASQSGPSAYLRSKAAAEELVRRAENLRWTIFRPSIVFGLEDSFLRMFARIVRLLPVIVLACPRARFQPVFVDDVARAFVASLENPDTVGQSYDLCGPDIYTLRELVEMVARLIGRKRLIVGLGDRLSYLQAWAMEWLPVKLMTRDNYYSMQVDSVCGCEFPAVFGLRPTPLASVLPNYVSANAVRERYGLFRRRAGR